MSRPIALITGAASGIGRGIAIHLGGRGYRVCVADLDGDRAAQVAAEIDALAPPAAGERAIAMPMDVASDASVGAAIASLAEPVSLLVNNAGLQQVAALQDLPTGRFAQLVDIMLNGAARTTAAALPRMRRAGSGRIINMGSIHSLVASPFKSAYVAAKHGLVGLTRTTALENADLEITVNMICPAYVLTPLVEQQIEAQARAHALSRDQVISEIMLKPMPKRRFIEMDEICAAVDYLASSGARNITGQCIVIDGGWTAQ